MMPSACIRLIASMAAFTGSWPCKHSEPIPPLSQVCVTKMGGGLLGRLPSKSSGASPGWRAPSAPLRAGRGRGCPHMNISSLRGFAGPFGFEGLLAAHVDLDLLGFGFGLLGQRNLQNALVVVRRNFLRVHGARQIEGTGEAAILALHAAVVLFFFFLLDLALTVDGEGIVLNADIDIFLVDARDFDLQANVVLVFVNVDGGGEARSSQGLILALVISLAKQPVHAVLQGRKLTKWFPTS